MRILVPSILCGLLGAIVSQDLPAQSLPKEQPKYITIEREKLKFGRSAEHARHEAGWPAAFAKANSTDYYLALASMTGAREVWYIIPWASHAAEEESMKKSAKDPALAAELDRLGSRDGEFIESGSTVQAMARPDLSIGKFPDTSKARYFEIGIHHVRPGQEVMFEKLAKAYGAARLRAAPDSSVRVYSVIAGMPTPSFLVITSVEKYAEFDRLASEAAATFGGANESENELFAKMGAVIERMEYNRYRVDPGQSYVPKDVREQDPEFWNPK